MSRQVPAIEVYASIAETTNKWCNKGLIFYTHLDSYLTIGSEAERIKECMHVQWWNMPFLLWQSLILAFEHSGICQGVALNAYTAGKVHYLPSKVNTDK